MIFDDGGRMGYFPILFELAKLLLKQLLAVLTLIVLSDSGNGFEFEYDFLEVTATLCSSAVLQKLLHDLEYFAGSRLATAYFLLCLQENTSWW